jgi:hypothetical protein
LLFAVEHVTMLPSLIWMLGSCTYNLSTIPDDVYSALINTCMRNKETGDDLHDVCRCSLQSARRIEWLKSIVRAHDPATTGEIHGKPIAAVDSVECRCSWMHFKVIVPARYCHVVLPH